RAAHPTTTSRPSSLARRARIDGDRTRCSALRSRGPPPMRLHRLRPLLLVLAVLAAAGACRDDDQRTAPTTTPPATSTTTTEAPWATTTTVPEDLAPLLLTDGDLPDDFVASDGVDDTITSFCVGQDAAAGLRASSRAVVGF